MPVVFVEIGLEVLPGAFDFHLCEVSAFCHYDKIRLVGKEAPREVWHHDVGAFVPKSAVVQRQLDLRNGERCIHAFFDFYVGG